VSPLIVALLGVASGDTVALGTGRHLGADAALFALLMMVLPLSPAPHERVRNVVAGSDGAFAMRVGMPRRRPAMVGLGVLLRAR